MDQLSAAWVVSSEQIVVTDVYRLLSTLNLWAGGTGATIYLYGSRVRGDHHADSDVDIFVDWPSDLNARFVDWWTRENGDLWKTISHALGARAEILDPDDKEQQSKIRAAKIVQAVGCAVAVHLPRVKPQV